jgi:hypothetical protein
MNKAALEVLISAGAIKQVRIIADGSAVYIETTTQTGDVSTITTNRGSIKCWVTIDAAAKWVKGLGIGKVQLEISRWLPGQRGMTL